eukprot:TRINITY_DN2163_c0_g1_i2.p4 TRINITY_DN2163_c0_g1~~TRINITY_DN2163_c0_g1_i2.p4  ORF type:complete len:107 (-),score=5.89 TRINITY_DN2163_c0_g1_i2:2527-2847(-)
MSGSLPWQRKYENAAGWRANAQCKGIKPSAHKHLCTFLTAAHAADQGQCCCAMHKYVADAGYVQLIRVMLGAFALRQVSYGVIALLSISLVLWRARLEALCRQQTT